MPCMSVNIIPSSLFVQTLINERQKGKQKMLWGREGAHNILQIRAAVRSNSWEDNWAKVQSNIYKIAA